MKIWIDLANAPHVNFFSPLIECLKDRGHTIRLTIRDFNQTPELAKLAGMDGVIIGKHGGKGLLRKMANLFARSWQLLCYCLQQRFDVAVSHNSYAQAVAGRIAGIRVITLMDFEGQPANHISFRAAHIVAVPNCINKKSLKKFNVTDSKLYKYEGFKEQVYLSSFKPDPLFIENLKKSCRFNPSWKLEDHILVTVRTPASMAAYHTFHNHTFDKLLCELNKRNDIVTIVLPRYPEQKELIKMQYPYVHIPDTALSGNNLTFYSDLVISGGGTMNREAAILGTPAYSIFAGELPAVDRKLRELGRLKSISNESELGLIKYEKKMRLPIYSNCKLINEIISLIESNPMMVFEPLYQNTPNVLANQISTIKSSWNNHELCTYHSCP